MTTLLSSRCLLPVDAVTELSASQLYLVTEDLLAGVNITVTVYRLIHFRGAFEDGQKGWDPSVCWEEEKKKMEGPLPDSETAEELIPFRSYLLSAESLRGK